MNDVTPENMDQLEPGQESAPFEGGPQKKKKHWWVVFAALGLLLIGASIGTAAGYQAGLQIRRQAQEDQIILICTEQFALGLQDMESGRYDMARNRFEYIISLDPAFPEAAQKLTEAIMASSIVLTPTVVATPTPVPTPDLRGEEELFEQIKTHLRERAWSEAITTIHTLRDRNLEYRAVDTDGFYYLALRFLAIDNILNQGQLETGLYNLALAEQIGPLDADALSYRIWARQYLSAASFWGIDWAFVVNAFSQIYPYLPNLRDASGMTATERFRIASIKYGDQLMLEEKYCEAMEQYLNALEISSDSLLQATADAAFKECEDLTRTPPPTATPTPTETNIAPQPTTVNTEEPPTQTETPVPTEDTGGGSNTIP